MIFIHHITSRNNIEGDVMFEFEKKIYKLDKEPIVKDAKFNFDDILIWPFIRNEIYEHLMAKELGFEKRHGGPGANRKLGVGKRIRKILETYIEANKQEKEVLKTDSQILFFYTLIRSKMLKNNKLFDKEIDYFAEQKYDTMVLFHSFDGNDRTKERSFKNAKCMDYINIKGTFFKKIQRKIQRKQSNYEITDFLYQNGIVDKAHMEKLNKELYALETTLPIIKRNYLKLVNTINPKIMFIRIASYGVYSHFVKWTKELGIKVGEFQHGLISKIHLAYNYDKELLAESDYKKIFPDYFLSYGDYWSTQLNIPSKCVTIGNPHFYNAIESYKNVYKENNTVLILSQGTMTKKFVEIAKYLSENLKGYSINFKLHPTEVYFEDRYRELYQYKNIDVIKEGDLYSYLASNENVISHSSTAVFEATAFNNKIFVVKDNHTDAYIPKEIGWRFGDNEELVRLIKEKKDYTAKYDAQHYFNQSWKENYLEFIKEIGVR